MKVSWLLLGVLSGTDRHLNASLVVEDATEVYLPPGVAGYVCLTVSTEPIVLLE